MKETVKQNQNGATEKPNDQAHPHGGRGETPENSATSPAPAVSGAVPCSASRQKPPMYMWTVGNDAGGVGWSLEKETEIAKWYGGKAIISEWRDGKQTIIDPV